MEKFDRGQWNQFLLERKYADLCQTLQVSTEPLYTLFSQFEKKSCPFPAGHIEKFTNGKTTGLPEQTPNNVQGKYRLVIEWTYMDKMKQHVDCTQAEAEIHEF